MYPLGTSETGSNFSWVSKIFFVSTEVKKYRNVNKVQEQFVHMNFSNPGFVKNIFDMSLFIKPAA